MKKLRIAVWHNLPSGGGKRQLYNHIKGLVQRGHYVESWCPDSADQKYLPLGDLVKEHVLPLDKKNSAFHHSVRPVSVVKELLGTMERHCQSCAEEINRGGFDVVYANACLYLRTSPIAGFVKVPSAIYLGEPYRWFYEAMPELPWIAPLSSFDGNLSLASVREYLEKLRRLNGIRLQARAELEYTKKFDLVLVNSEYSRETILRTYNLESKVCYLGIDTDHYRPTGEARGDFVVGLGTIYYGKGVDRAIKAISTIDAACRPDLVWIGNGASEADLKGYRLMAQELGVSFHPKVHITDQEVVGLLSRARAMVYVSRLEPFGLAPLEANACGTPVVGIAEGGVRETIRNGENGFLSPDDDPQVIGGLIKKFIDDPEMTETMGGRAREYVKTIWNMKTCTDNVESFFYRLCGKAGGRKIEVDNEMLRDLQPTDDIRMNLDELSLSKNRVRGKGWAFIDDGKSPREAKVYLVLQRGAKLNLVPTVKQRRFDVTEYFGSEIDYSDAGFSVDQPVDGVKGCTVGLLIARDEKMSFTYVR